MMKTSLRNRILGPLTLGLFSLLVIFLVSLFWIERKNIDQRVEGQFKSSEQFFYSQQENDAHLLSGMLETIMNDRAIQAALKAEDRKALLAYTAPLFQRISLQHPVTHLYFSDAHRINLLRVHQPDRYGDRIDRVTTLKAERTGKIAYGLELGPLGTLTLRVVAPMIVNGQRIGFVELGEEIDHITAKLKKTIGVELMVYLHKKSLDRPGWEAGMKMMGRANDWDRFPDVVLAGKTLKVYSETLTKFFSEGSHTPETTEVEIVSQNRRYRCRFLDIKDAKGLEVGDMVVMVDVTSQINHLYSTMGVIAGFSVLLGGLLFFLFRFFLGRVENQLTEAQQKIIDLEKDRTRMESEAKFYSVAQSVNDAMISSDPSGKITFWNPAAVIMFGYQEEEVLGQPLTMLLPERYRVAHQKGMERIQSGGDGRIIGKTTKLVGLKKDGAEFPLELSLSQWTAGNETFYTGLVRDITKRKLAEEDLRKNEERYRTILEDIDEGYFENDLAGNFTFVNDAECRDLGYSREELIGMNYRHYSDEATAKNLYELFYNIYNTRKPVKRFLEQFISKDGTRHYNEVSASLIRDANGEPIGFRGVSQDITERKRAEEELRLSEERFKRIFDEGHFGMILTNPDYTIVMANKALCGLLGYSEQELVGQSVADITCEEDREKNREFSEQLFSGSIPVFRLEKRYVRKDGGIVLANITTSAIHGKEGNVLYGLVIIEDLTESRKAAEKIHLLHYYDSLTGLPNRIFHKELIKRSIEHALRHKEKFAIIYIGLDNFQRINDTLGYSSGDILLKTVADRLTDSLRKSDYVARSDEGGTANVVSRVGGDEFIVLAHDLNQAQDAAIASRRLLRDISAPYDLSGREIFITASIGIALYPDDGTDVDDLLKNAEKAMRYTKSEGENNYHFYSISMHSMVLELLTMESDLHKALERDELMLYYQPKVDAASRKVTGMEALIRWKHPDKGLIPPIQFIPLAEASGLIIPIGEFVIRTVCKQIKTWEEAGYKQINIALNLSSRQFDQPNLIEIVKEALRDTLIFPLSLELEITESTIMRNPEKVILILTELKALGIQLAIDDFGTGYSSLSYLKRLPLDFLKIDQSFVKGLVYDPKDQAIVRATISMAHNLNLKTIAEGVETEEQLSFLQEHGCDEIQGYLFSRPLPAEEIPGILVKGYL